MTTPCSLTTFSTPHLEKLHSGKVRDSFRVDEKTRLIVVSDRISAFDRVLECAVPGKGAVLNGIANFWFERTRTVVPNHLILAVDPQASLVREVQPIRVEMIVRAYITGSAWRGYKDGKRSFSGVAVPDGVTINGRLPQPIVTPTTKEENDQEVTPAEIVELGLASSDLYEQMEQAAWELFAGGTRVMAEKGLLLADTKYEFGLLDGKLMLIDEIHTPDSSRFWPADSYERDPAQIQPLDKEYVRAWLLKQKAEGRSPTSLPDEIVAGTTRRYLDLYELVTGTALELPEGDPAERLARSLADAGLV